MVPRMFFASLGLLAILFSSTAALAEDAADYSREGPTLGFDALYAIDASSSSADFPNTGGLAVRIGFRMVPELAVGIEGEWSDLGGRNPWSISTLAKLYVLELLDSNPLESVLGGRLQPFVVSSIGITAGHLGHGTEPAATFRFGAGSDYWLSSDLALTSQLVYVGNAGAATDYSSVNLRLGVTWRY